MPDLSQFTYVFFYIVTVAALFRYPWLRGLQAKMPFTRLGRGSTQSVDPGPDSGPNEPDHEQQNYKYEGHITL